MGQTNLPTFGGARKNSNKLIIPKLALLTLLVLNSLHVAHSAKILFYLGLSSRSHRIALQPIADKLSEKGHEITFLSPFKPEVENPKIKEFYPQGLKNFNDRIDRDYKDDPVATRLADKFSDPWMDNFGALVWVMQYDCNEATLTSPDLLQLVETSKFDLLVTEFPYKEVSLAIAHKNKAKVVAFCPSTLLPTDGEILGIPSQSSWLPDMGLGSWYSQYIPKRYSYEINIVMWHLYYTWLYLPNINSLIQRVFPNDNIPHIEEMIRDMNVYLVNTHFSHDYGISLPPSVVSVGGLHVKETSDPLPKNIEDFIQGDESDGFVYISFGSIVNISWLPKDTRKYFFDAIRSFPNARFLLKWNDEIPEDMPKNVLPLKWFPQQDILAHPKCRGFVSQGGLMSFQQATYRGVPVVIMPVFVDQPYNARSAVHHGNGIHLELADLTLESFSNAISQLLYNETLSAQAKQVAVRFKDRPMSPLDTAIWWVEYVLRHNDTSHLKPLGIHQKWWQRRLLDFWAIVFVGLLLISFCIIWIVRSLLRLCSKVQRKPEEKVKSS